MTLDIVLILCVHIAQSFNAQDEIKGKEDIQDNAKNCTNNIEKMLKDKKN